MTTPFVQTEEIPKFLAAAQSAAKITILRVPVRQCSP
jgi:hypothetical protein